MLLKLSKEINAMGYNPAMATSQDKCMGCALCAEMCPDLAIKVYNRTFNEFAVIDDAG
jgi:2-oxoglutarate ferredoxin oxidoreductase subunit delta